MNIDDVDGPFGLAKLLAHELRDQRWLRDFPDKGPTWEDMSPRDRLVLTGAVEAVFSSVIKPLCDRIAELEDDLEKAQLRGDDEESLKEEAENKVTELSEFVTELEAALSTSGIREIIVKAKKVIEG